MYKNQHGIYAQIANCQYAIQGIAEKHVIDAFKLELFFVQNVSIFVKYVGYGFAKDVNANAILLMMDIIKINNKNSRILVRNLINRNEILF